MGPDPRIADYIAANRRRYTREAIRQQLLDAGYDAGAIDATWAVLDTPDADDHVGGGFWRRFALIVIGINLAAFVVVGLLSGMFATAGASAFLLGILALALGIGALIAWGLVALVGPARMSPTTATVAGVTIPLLLALLVGGSCYALVSAIGPPPPAPVSGTMHLDLGAPLDVDGEISAQCQLTAGGPGYAVYANLPGPGQRPLYVSVSSYPGEPGASAPPQVFISLEPTEDPSQPPLAWSNEGPDGPRIEADISDDGLNGSVSFDALPSLPMEGPASTADALSGTVSWSCNE